MGGGLGLKHVGIRCRAKIRLTAMKWMVGMGLCLFDMDWPVLHWYQSLMSG